MKRGGGERVGSAEKRLTIPRRQRAFPGESLGGHGHELAMNRYPLHI